MASYPGFPVILPAFRASLSFLVALSIANDFVRKIRNFAYTFLGEKASELRLLYTQKRNELHGKITSIFLPN